MMLLVACSEAEAALMLKLLLDQQNGSRNDLFYLISEDFNSVDLYVDAIVSRLHREFNAAAEAGETDILPIPNGCNRSSGNTASARLKECFGYARSLVSPSTGHRIVWCLSPGTIVNLGAYERLLQECVSTGPIEPWMRGLRLFARLPATTTLGRLLAAAPFVEYFPFAIPEDASERELREDIKNPRLPLGDRSQSLLQLGFIDMAHGRADAAKQGLRESLAIAQQTNDPALQALSMIGLGDTSYKEKDFAKAKYWYECAIIPAGDGKQIMCLAMIAEKLGAIAFHEARFADAEFYYDQLCILKRSIPDENGLVDALLWRGRSQMLLVQPDQAVASFQEAILLCKSFDLAHRETECMGELRRGFEAAGRTSHGDLECSDWLATQSLSEA